MENEFILTLIGQLDEEKTKQNIQTALKNLGKIDKKTQMKVYDEEELKKQGIKYITSVKDIQQQIKALYGTEDIKINLTAFKDATGEVNRYTAEITKADQMIEKLNLDRAAFTNGNNGFIVTNSFLNDKSLGNTLTQQTDQINKYREAIEKLNTKYLTGNNNNTLLKDSNNIQELYNKLKQLDLLLDKVQKTAGTNSNIKMQGIKELVTDAQNLANYFSQAEKNISQTENKVLAQKNTLDNYALKLKEIQNTALNTSSGKQLIDSKHLDTVANKVKSLQGMLNGMYKGNNNNKIIPTEALNKFDLMLKQCNLDIKTFRDEENKAFNNLNTNSFNDSLKATERELKQLQSQLKATGTDTTALQTKLQSSAKQVLAWAGVTSSIALTAQTVRKLIDNVKELDSSMTNLKKATDFTSDTYDKVFNSAVEQARELHSSILDIINSTTDFSKLGFDKETSQQLAEIANIYKNVSNISAEDATTALVSAVNGYKDLNAEDAMKIVDIYTKISNSYAISAGGIGDAIKRSGAALSEASNDIAQSVAMITTANATIADPSRVGNAMKTVALRVRGVKKALEEAGESTEDMFETTAQLRDAVLSITKVDIMESDGTTFKSTYEILKEIGKQWQNISDQKQKAYILDRLAGKQNANVLAALLNNADMLESVYNDALQANGAAIEGQEAWSKSIQASLNDTKQRFESISSNLLTSDTFKNTVDGFNKILDIIEKITAKGNNLKFVFGAMGGALGATGKGLFDADAINKANKAISEYNALSVKGKTDQLNYANSIKATNANLANYLTTTDGAKASLAQYAAQQAAATAADIARKIAVQALNVTINAFIGIGVGLIVNGFTEIINKGKELQEQFQRNTETIKEQTKTLDQYKDRIDSVIDSSSSETDKIKQLNDIKDELSEKYRREIDDIKDVTEARKILNAAIQEETNNELDKYYLENKKQFENQTKKLINLGISVSDDDMLLSGKGQADIDQKIKDLFSTFDVYQDEKKFTIDANVNGKDIFEYYDNLEQVILKIDDIRNKSANGLTDSEELLYKNLKDRYKMLSDMLDGKEFSRDTYNESLEMFAKHYISSVEQGTKSIEEWKAALFSLNDVSKNQFLKETIENIINSEKDLAVNSENIVNPLSDVLAKLGEVETGLESVTDKIKNANESFEDLEKVIKNNNDSNKYFSGSEMVELLEKYPDLHNAIQKTEYGYKLEADALEKLRQAKIEQQKEAIAAEILETNKALQLAQLRLDKYGQENQSIKDIADAKAKLANIDLLLSQGTLDDAMIQSLNARKATLNDYIKAAEDIEKYNKSLKSLQAQWNILGNVFDDVKNSTKDTTAELNKQKTAIKDLSDEYKKAKDNIENLVSLTTEMIKKQKQDEKEILDNQLKNYNSIIEKKREVLELSKEQHDFEKNLADSNKELLTVQNELESLSIAGANYSLEDLKRKADLEEKAAELKEKRDELLYDHEYDSRVDALEKEQSAFEETIKNQQDAIDDYLKHDGIVRQDAMKLINGKTQEFYNDLYSYTMNFTTKSDYEFTKLWNDAYNSLAKYGNIQTDVSSVLSFLSIQILDCENQIKSLDDATNAAKNSLSDLANNTINSFKNANDTIGETVDLLSKFVKVPTVKVSDLQNPAGLIQANQNYADALLKLKGLQKYHEGGIVSGETNGHGEILAKLLTGEIVVTEEQQKQFVEKTLPKLANTSNTYNNSNSSYNTAPQFNMNFNISGNADKSTVSAIQDAAKKAVNEAFSQINKSNHAFNGNRIK